MRGDPDINKFLSLTGLDLLEGRYKIQQEVGLGKSSTCFFGVDIITGNEIFIKLLIFPRSKLEIARFRNEIKFFKKRAIFNDLIKKTPNHIADGEIFGGRVMYLVTERIHGTLLSDWIEQNISSAELFQRLKIAYRVFGATEYQSLHFTHRDLHANNILLLNGDIDLYSQVPDYKTIILDWGQSYCRVLYEYSESDDDDMVVIHNGIGKEITSSFYNIPPEIFSNWEVGSEYNKYDSWAMGLLLYKLLTGKDLFSFKHIGEYASSIGKIANRVRLVRFELESIAGAAAPILSALISRLMSVDPENRMFIQEARFALWFIMVEEFRPDSFEEIHKFLDSPTHYTGVKWKHFTVEEFDYS